MGLPRHQIGLDINVHFKTGDMIESGRGTQQIVTFGRLFSRYNGNEVTLEEIT